MALPTCEVQWDGSIHSVIIEPKRPSSVTVGQIDPFVPLSSPEGLKWLAAPFQLLFIHFFLPS
jgi:hypothetical protein